MLTVDVRRRRNAAEPCWLLNRIMWVLQNNLLICPQPNPAAVGGKVPAGICRLRIGCEGEADAHRKSHFICCSKDDKRRRVFFTPRFPVAAAPLIFTSFHLFVSCPCHSLQRRCLFSTPLHPTAKTFSLMFLFFIAPLMDFFCRVFPNLLQRFVQPLLRVSDGTK